MSSSDEPRYVADDEPDVEPPLVTKTGRVLTQADIDRLVEEAERGYDPERLVAAFRCPRCGRRSFHPHDVAEGYCGNCHDWTGR